MNAPSTTRTVSFDLNGSAVETTVAVRTLASDLLRHQLGATGTHVGCEQGACGACTVLIDGVAQRSCLTLAPQLDGATVETIESVAPPGGLDPIQQALHDHHGLQCGFCTPGIVMSLVGARRAGVDPATAIDQVLEGHLCRCTGYQNIRAAIASAWDELVEPES